MPKAKDLQFKIQYNEDSDKIVVEAEKTLEDPDYDGSNVVGAILYGSSGHDPLVFEEVLYTAEELIGKDGLVTFPAKLLFLKTSIFILRETGRRFVDKPFLTEDLIYLYWKTCKEAIEGKDKNPDYVLDACEKYLALIEDDATEDWFERKRKKEDDKASREQECVDISKTLNKLYKNANSKRPEKTSAKLNEDQNSVELNKDQERQCLQLMELAKEKLMYWYNIKDSVEISMVQKKAKRFLRVQKFIKLYGFEFSAGIFLFLCIFVFIFPTFHLDQFVSFKNIFFPQIVFQIVLPLIYLFAFFSLLRLISSIKKEQKSYPDFHIHLPRLWAGIVVGYLVLLNDEAWEGIFKVDDLKFGLGRAFLPCLAVFFYIIAEISNVKGINLARISNKIRQIFLRGAAYAVLMGMVISDLFGKNMVEIIFNCDNSDCMENLLFFKGFFGNIYPEVLFYLAPLALFIGVFVQLLWDNKTLTAKLKGN